MELIDNTSKTLRDDLADEIKEGSKLSVAAACFSNKKLINLSVILDAVEETENGWEQFYNVTTGEIESIPDSDNSYANVNDYEEIPTISLLKRKTLKNLCMCLRIKDTK